MINKKLDSEKNSQLNNRYIKRNIDTKNNLNTKNNMNIKANIKANANVNVNSKNSNEQEENIKAFRKAYYDLLYHYDNTKEKQQIRALVIRKENIFSKIKNKVKSFLFY